MRGRQCSVAVMPWRRSVLRVGKRGARLRDHIPVSPHSRPVVATFNRHARRLGLNRECRFRLSSLVSRWRQAVHPIAFNTAIARRQGSDVRHPSVSSRYSTAMHRLRSRKRESKKASKSFLLVGAIRERTNGFQAEQIASSAILLLLAMRRGKHSHVSDTTR
jgi:hypothetical protein